MQELFKLKLAAAVVLGGLVHRAGALVEVTENVAKDLLRRGKAVLAEVEDELEHMLGNGDDKADTSPATEPGTPAATTPPAVSPVDDTAAKAKTAKAK